MKFPRLRRITIAGLMIVVAICAVCAWALRPRPKPEPVRVFTHFIGNYW